MTTSRRRRTLQPKASEQIQLEDLKMAETVMLSSGWLEQFAAGAVIRTEDQLRSFYRRHRRYFLTMRAPDNCTDRHWPLYHRPGCRPWIWWRVEMDREPPEPDTDWTEASTLRRLGVLTAQEEKLLKRKRRTE